MGTACGQVIVAMSGGVDSSVAACLLHEQGFAVTGLFMRMGLHEPEEQEQKAFRTATVRERPGPGPEANEPAGALNLAVIQDRHRGCCSAVDAADARLVAGRLGIPFFALNFKDQFDRIIEYFADEYLRGRTPNPCVMCNEHLKFGRLADYGAAAGADFIATGHYARIEVRDGQHQLCRGADPAKDQSYVLFGIGRDTLSRTLLPIGGMTKDEVRDHARRFGLPVSDKPDSVDICFVPDRDYARVVRERRPEAFAEGAILDSTGREVGRHGGVVNFTIGQRRGVGVAVGRPAYVTAIDPQTNTITIGDRQALASDSLTASRVRWLVDAPQGPLRADVKIRYAHQPAPATIEPLPGDRVRVRFDEPQFAVTPGQAAVFYHADTVLGGGWID